MLFFGVFLRETARPVAKSRTNLAQIQEKLPNRWTDSHQIWHTYADSSGNGYMPNQLNLKTQGGISGGGLGGHKSKRFGRFSNDWTDWHQIWYTSADSSGNGHRVKTIRPSTLGGGGVRGSQIQKSGDDVKRLVRLASNLVHMCRFIWEWIYAKQIALRDTRGHLGGGGGLRGSNIKNSGEAVKRLDRLAPTLVHVCGFIWEWA